MNSSDQNQLPPPLALLWASFHTCFQGPKAESSPLGAQAGSWACTNMSTHTGPKGGAKLEGINPHHAVSYKEHEAGDTAGTGSRPTSPLIYSALSRASISGKYTYLLCALRSADGRSNVRVTHCCHNPNPRELLQLALFRAAHPVDKDLSVYVSGTIAAWAYVWKCTFSFLPLKAVIVPNKQHQTESISRKLKELHLKQRAKLHARWPTVKNKTNWAPIFSRKSQSKPVTFHIGLSQKVKSK